MQPYTLQSQSANKQDGGLKADKYSHPNILKCFQLSSGVLTEKKNTTNNNNNNNWCKCMLRNTGESVPNVVYMIIKRMLTQCLT